MEDSTLNILTRYPVDIKELNLRNMEISGTLDLSRFTNLEILNCQSNKISSIGELPKSLKELYCQETFLNVQNLKQKYPDIQIKIE